MGVFFALEWSKFDFNIAQQSGHDLTKHVTCSYQAARLPCGWRGISKHALHLCFCEFFAYGADAFTLNPSTVLNWIFFFVVSRMFMVIYIWNDQDPHIFDMDDHRWLKHKNHDAVCLEILPLQVINAVSMSLWLMKYLNWFWLSWVVSQSINWKIQKHILRMWLFAYLKVERPKWKAFPTNGPPFLQLPKTRPIPICPPHTQWIWKIHHLWIIFFGKTWKKSSPDFAFESRGFVSGPWFPWQKPSESASTMSCRGSQLWSIPGGPYLTITLFRYPLVI